MPVFGDCNHVAFCHERVVRQVSHLLHRLGVLNVISEENDFWEILVSAKWQDRYTPSVTLSRERALDCGESKGLLQYESALQKSLLISQKIPRRDKPVLQSNLGMTQVYALSGTPSHKPAPSGGGFPQALPQRVISLASPRFKGDDQQRTRPSDWRKGVQSASDIYWDRIISIEYVGKKQTYDLEVPGTHNFIANDIIVHNSHAAAYSVLAFKTGYMKAHYPAEYMAAVLTHNVNDIKKITFFIEECRRMGIEVLPPDINESKALFSVNKKGQIRFGLEAIKGVGHAVVETLVKEREKDGAFDSLFDLTVRMPLRSINRKTLESLAYAGALDCFGVERFQYFLPMSDKDQSSVLDKAVSYGSKVQQERNSPQVSLFAGLDNGNGGSYSNPEPAIPMGTMQDGRIVEAWSELDKLNYEKEVIGFYLSGHPLNRFKWQMDAFTNCTISDLEEKKPQDVKTAGIVTSVRERISRRGNKFMSFNIEDFGGSIEITLFGEQYEKFRGLIRQDEMLYLTGAYQPRRYDPSEYELRIFDMRLMSTDLFDGMMKHLTVEVDNTTLDEAFLEQLKTLFSKHEGSKQLKFRVRDARYQADIKMVSSSWKIAPSNELVKDLEEVGVRWWLG